MDAQNIGQILRDRNIILKGGDVITNGGGFTQVPNFILVSKKVSVGANTRPKDAAEEFLKRELGDGPRKAKEMLALADLVGISERTLARARTRIGVKSEQKRGHWIWSLPST